LSFFLLAKAAHEGSNLLYEDVFLLRSSALERQVLGLCGGLM
jgi:hypothetical protein